MKSLLLMAALAALVSPSAFAMKKVQFDVRFNLDICPLNADGKTCSMIDGGEAMPVETVVAEADPDGNPDIDEVSFEKAYTLKRVFGAEADLVLDVSFYPSFLDKKVTEMSVTMSDPAQTGGLEPDQSESSISVTDLAAVKNYSVNGKAKFLAIPGSAGLMVQPRVWITNVKVLE